MALTGDQVRWVAHLARLEFSPEELDVFTDQLSKIVDYVNQLQQINTEGVEPLSHALPIHNVFRPDETKPSLTADEALANAPDRKGNFYGVPAVLD
jgi:aspartyl-tRNA(Asn)/glutamyl-tRNA(Gln) amidotransferase subunit C